MWVVPMNRSSRSRSSYWNSARAEAQEASERAALAATLLADCIDPGAALDEAIDELEDARTYLGMAKQQEAGEDV